MENKDSRESLDQSLAKSQFVPKLNLESVISQDNPRSSNKKACDIGELTYSENFDSSFHNASFTNNSNTSLTESSCVIDLPRQWPISFQQNTSSHAAAAKKDAKLQIAQYKRLKQQNTVDSVLLASDLKTKEEEKPPIQFKTKESAMDELLDSWRSMTTTNSVLFRESLGSTGGPQPGLKQSNIGQEKEISDHLIYLHKQVDKIIA